MEAEAQRHFTNLGRSLVQMNLRLTQLAELVEARQGPTGDGGSLELLLDLVDAVERTTEAGAAAPPRLPWALRIFGVRPPPSHDLSGLVLARDHVIRQLERTGLVRAHRRPGRRAAPPGPRRS